MTTLDPFLGAQSLQIKPLRSRIALRHRGDIALRNIATEKFDDDVGDLARRERQFAVGLPAPMTHRNTIEMLNLRFERNVRADAPKRLQIVHPQGGRDMVLLPELLCQTPANADIAKIVDDMAKQVECVVWKHESGAGIESAYSNGAQCNIGAKQRITTAVPLRPAKY